MDLCLTLDYEVFGKGSGDIFRHMIDPTERLLRLFERKTLKTTIFFEVIEYLKIREEWNSGNRMGYADNPAAAIEDQLRKAYHEGHDIQLHLHPQWINAVYEEGWNVDKKYWRLPLVNRKECGCSIEELLVKGKKTIENIIKPVDENYRCTIMRAADFNIYPSGEICRAMRKAGIIADSSIIPGAAANDGYSYFNYIGIPTNIPFWFVNGEDLEEVSTKYQDGRSLIELPIFSLPVRRFRKFDFHRIKVKMENREYALQRLKQKTGTKPFLERVRYYLEREAVPWDFTLSSYGRMKNSYRMASETATGSGYEFHPIILIGHSKEFVLENPLKKFIEYALGYGASFKTLSEVIVNIAAGTGG